MHAEATYGDTGSKFGKIAIVTALHLGFALALINMKTIVNVLPPAVTDVVPLPTPAPPPPPPDPAPMPVEQLPELTPPPFRPEQVTFADPLPTPPLPKVGPEDTGPPVDGGGGTVSAGNGGGGGTEVAPPKPAVFTAALANAKDCVLPEYPKSALRNGDTGTVSLALLIGTNGQVTESKVQKSSGFRDLDRAAVAALSMCKFKPAMNNGVAQPAWGQLAYVWRLD